MNFNSTLPLLGLFLFSLQSFGASSLKLYFEKAEAKDGTIAILYAEPGDSKASHDLKFKFKDVSGSFVDHPTKQGLKVALVPVPHSTKPGDEPVTVIDGKESTQVVLKIVDGGYSIETLKVDNKHVDPPKKVMKRILAEIKEVGALYNLFTQKRYWDGKFFKPIDSPMTSPYGGKRVYNGVTKNFHAGLDLKAATGTPIKAPAAGKVVLAKDLYFSGGCILIDHGFGLFTMYAHLSKIIAKVGQEVKAGDLIASSGATGRVTGPHLHWSVILNKQKVDPARLLEEF